MTNIIRTKAPGKGDLVPGHNVAMFWPNLPALTGTVVDVSESGHQIIVELDAAIAAFIGSDRRIRWTWRQNAASYQQLGQRTQEGCGLALIPRSRRNKTKGAGR